MLAKQLKKITINANNRGEFARVQKLKLARKRIKERIRMFEENLASPPNN